MTTIQRNKLQPCTFLFDHPHFFPVAMKARSTTMPLPPPQRTPACVYYFFFFFFFIFLFFLFFFCCSACLFRFSLRLRLLLPSLRLLHRRLFLILTHGAHGSHALTRRREWLIDRKEIVENVSGKEARGFPWKCTFLIFRFRPSLFQEHTLCSLQGLQRLLKWLFEWLL